MTAGYSVFAPEGLPEVHPGDDVAALLLAAFAGHPLHDGDILVLAHKVVSKAEGCVRPMADVKPGERALALADETGRDPRLVQVILDESRQLLWHGPGGPLICQHKNGWVCANAGADCSNAGPDTVITLPQDPDASAQAIRQRLEAALDLKLGVLICDTHGRPFRNAAVGMVIGAAGVRMEKSYVGLADRNGRVMQSAVEGVGDELAAAATLVMGQGDEGRPVAVVRGLGTLLGQGNAAQLVRGEEQDIFTRVVMALEDSL